MENYIKMRLRTYLLNELFISNPEVERLINFIRKELKIMTMQEVERKCRESFNTIFIEKKYVKNKEALENFIEKYKLNRIMDVNEDFRHWWQLVSKEAFPTLAFYPALQVWLELDKYIKNENFNVKIIVFYAALWIVIVTGKYIIGWIKWKKENPDEYDAERRIGRGGLI